MTEKAENDGKNQHSSETNGFKFAVTLLAAFGTIFYTVYNYLQHTAVDIYWYKFLCGIISVTLILVVGLLLYILIMGWAMEVHSVLAKRKAEGWASDIYLASFLAFVMLLVYILLTFVAYRNGWISPKSELPLAILSFLVCSILYYLFFKETTISEDVIGLFFIILLLLYYLFFKETSINNRHAAELVIIFGIIICCLPLIKKPGSSEKYGGYQLIKVVYLLALVMTILLLLFFPVLNSPLQGHVTVDMDSICYTDGAPIPVLIQVTGPNTNLSIKLSKESDHNLTLIDSIKLKPEHNEKQTAYINKNSVLPGNLSGNTLGEGKYSVFINTTNLTTGYYEIKSVRPEYTESYGVKRFYLLDNS
ncbi:MAG: hypothetical protein AEth_00603 [Candidatus Argoarchaeum ethanivorans]|uniref:Uncharacterized protein n=1 Tax=Candidatus Argoarchaeum ethanivorans TaxID=2608793 RepID=A0A8B6SDG7_9EURY|nr:MAG: hypothetical protein AEth_00603 [Candidatus Argoarchaeum ethanivorans]